MPMLRKLATIATAAEAARRYARRNPEAAGKYLDQAAEFIDKQTKGKYSSTITGAVGKVKGAAGIPAGAAAPTVVPADPASNGQLPPATEAVDPKTAPAPSPQPRP
jgi:hypothetical protein